MKSKNLRRLGSFQVSLPLSAPEIAEKLCIPTLLPVETGCESLTLLDAEAASAEPSEQERAEQRKEKAKRKKVRHETIRCSVFFRGLMLPFYCRTRGYKKKRKKRRLKLRF